MDDRVVWSAPPGAIPPKEPGEVRLVHTADLHLDFPNDRFRPEQRATRRKELRERLGHVADVCALVQADALLVAGDLFHQDYASAETVVFCLETLGRLAGSGVKVLVVPGNHDPVSTGGRSIWETYAFPEGVRVFGDAERWEPFVLKESLPRVTVWGLAFRKDRGRDHVLRELASAVARDDGSGQNSPGEDAYRVALVHGQVTGYAGYGGSAGYGAYAGYAGFDEAYYPIDPAEVALAPVDYLALGHVHSARTVSAASPIAVYPGALSRLEADDVDERFVALVRLKAPNVEVAMVPVPDREFVDLTYDMGAGSLEGLITTLQAVAAGRRAAGQAPRALGEAPRALGEVVARVRVTGVLAQGAELFQQAVAASLADRFFHLEVVDETVVLSDDLSVGDTVKACFVRELASVLNDPTASERDKEVARLAVQYGLAALRGELR